VRSAAISGILPIMTSCYEVTQRLMSVATYYDIRETGTDAVVMHVKGALMSPTPSSTLTEEASGKVLGSLRGNFNKTHFEVLDAESKRIAEVEFPVVAFKKTLTLKMAEKTYHADAGVLSSLYDFACMDADGAMVLRVKKPEGLTKVRDRFIVEPADGVAKEIGLLVAVAIHARYFELI